MTPLRSSAPRSSLLGLALLLGCGPSVQVAATPVTPKPPETPAVEQAHVRPDASYLLPPAVAFQRNLMPLAPTGIPAWRAAHPEWDGRGALIAILDSGVDPGVAGLKTTSTGQPKLVDLRDFSGEGAIPLTRVTPTGDVVTVGGRTLKGFGRLMGVNASGPWYAGTLREIPLGESPAADVNWNNIVGDTLPVLVTKGADGWVLLADLDGDGSLANEHPIHDYLVARERFGWSTDGHAPSVDFAVNFAEQGGEPLLDLYFDTSGHGTHVAGIASGNDMYGVAGFDGVAPGAEVMGLKIANDAQGGISTTGSMLAALDYAIKAAAQRQKPLVVNMSFGVGNEREGAARIDQLFDSVLTAHPDVVFAVSAGNDGPGLSTLGFPGSASRVLSVGATFPRAFLMRDPDAGEDPIAYFSSRGGEVARPDIVTPGVAFSTVPPWNQGDEVKGGTSMASPHAAGLAALLVSAMLQNHLPVSALRVRQALMTTAQPLDGLTIIDQGAGLPNVGRAWAWLQRNADFEPLLVTAVDRDGTATGSAAFRGDGIAAGDTVQRFQLRWGGNEPAAPLDLAARSDQPWLHVAPRIRTARGGGEVTVGYDASKLRVPGTYVGTVTLWGRDTMAGPFARLVNTVVVPAPPGAEVSGPTAPLAAGLEHRWSFGAEAGRPFSVQIMSATSKDVIRGYLHEPGGRPYRGGNEQEGSSGENAATFRVDARDVVAGNYEAIAAAPPISASTAGIHIVHAPFTLLADLQGGKAIAALRNVTAAPVTANVTAGIVGAAERVTVSGVGADTGRVTFDAPTWARKVVVDLQMATVDWPRFTDFGVTLEDADGRQIEKAPLNYAFGRLEAELPRSWHGGPVTLKLFPGWATTAAGQRYSLDAELRIYASDSGAVALAPEGSATLTLPPGQGLGVTFAPVVAPWTLPAGFVPLLRYTATVGNDEGWTREAPLLRAPTPMMR